MAKEKDWIKWKSIGNDVVEVYYIESDDKGVYVVKETMNQNGTTKERKRDVILDFPIELLEFNRIKEFDNPYYKYNELVYRINIDGKEYTDSIKQIRLLIQKRVVKQPFYSKYGFKFKGYLNMIFRSLERKLEMSFSKEKMIE